MDKISAMDVDEEPICINEFFPVEIMNKFFSYLDSKELLKCMKVCKCWRFQIDEFIGIDLHIGRRNNDIWRNYDGIPFGNIKAMKQFGSRKVFISELENPRQNFRPPVPTDVWKQPDMIQYLWIDGYLRQEMFRNVIHDLKNLQKLEIHFNTLASLNPGDLSTVLSLESLVHLNSFAIRTFTIAKNLQYKSIGNGLTNAIGLFASQIKFPRLRSLFLSFPFCGTFIRGLCQFIAKFMIRHANTLNSFKLSFRSYARSAKVFQFPAGADNAVTARDLAVLNLNSIELFSLRDNPPELSLFQEFINGQKNLAVVHSKIKFLPPDEIAQPLRNCLQNLKSIQLSIEANADRPFDLNIFSNCYHLKRLGLIGDSPRIQGINSDRQHLIGGGLVPKTLEILSLYSLNISSMDIHELLSNQKNLKSLRCGGIGIRGDLGISFETTLCECIGERIIERIYLGNSVNRDSVDNGRRAAGNPVLNSAAVFYLSYVSGTPFNICLNEQNLYIPAFEYDSDSDDEYENDSEFPDGGIRQFAIHQDLAFHTANITIKEAASDVEEDEEDFDSGSEPDDPNDADYVPPNFWSGFLKFWSGFFRKNEDGSDSDVN